MAQRHIKVTVRFDINKSNGTLHVRSTGVIRNILMGVINQRALQTPLPVGTDAKSVTIDALNKAIGLVQLS